MTTQIFIFNHVDSRIEAVTSFPAVNPSEKAVRIDSYIRIANEHANLLAHLRGKLKATDKLDMEVWQHVLSLQYSVTETEERE